MSEEICDTNIKIDLIELDGKLQRMMDGIDTVKDRQENMADDIIKIKEAVYNPDEGIYARLREVEGWKKTHSRLMWMIITSGVGITTAFIFNNLAFS
jgi:hypothetical protein